MTYTNAEVNKTYTNVIPYATNVIPYGMSEESESKAVGVINKGESYLFSDGKWTDQTEIKEELAKIALQQDDKRVEPKGFKAGSLDRITVDNFPIKAILVPADKHK